ncbi:hypothetical protein ACNITZ_28020, partial [Escherichia coli]
EGEVFFLSGGGLRLLFIFLCPFRCRDLLFVFFLILLERRGGGGKEFIPHTRNLPVDSIIGLNL